MWAAGDKWDQIIRTKKINNNSYELFMSVVVLKASSVDVVVLCSVLFPLYNFYRCIYIFPKYDKRWLRVYMFMQADLLPYVYVVIGRPKLRFRGFVEWRRRMSMSTPHCISSYASMQRGWIRWVSWRRIAFESRCIVLHVCLNQTFNKIARWSDNHESSVKFATLAMAQRYETVR